MLNSAMVQIFPIHVLPWDGQPLSAHCRLLLQEAQHIVAGKHILQQVQEQLDCTLLRKDLIWHSLRNPLEESLSYISHQQAKGEKVVVMGHGDPLYFGIGATLIQRLGKEKLCIHSGISILQRLCALIGYPWHAVVNISLHGRGHSVNKAHEQSYAQACALDSKPIAENTCTIKKLEEVEKVEKRTQILHTEDSTNDIYANEAWYALYHALMRKQAVCVLTDAHNTPAHIAQQLQKRGVRSMCMYILERWSEKPAQEQQLTVLHLEEACAYTACQPCTVLLLPFSSGTDLSPHGLTALPTYVSVALPAESSLKVFVTPSAESHSAFRVSSHGNACIDVPFCPHVGLDDRLLQKEQSLITKPLVRGAIFSLLGLENNHTLWDVGAGSGAVALEATALARRVVAIEQHASRVQDIQENRRRFGALTLDIIQGKAPECFARLLPSTRPQRIFVGGGLGYTPVQRFSSDSSSEYSFHACNAHPLLDALCDALAPGGRMVMSAVLLGTVHSIQTYFQYKGWPVQCQQIQINRAEPLGKGSHHDMRLVPQNPVFLLSVEKAG